MEGIAMSHIWVFRSKLAAFEAALQFTDRLGLSIELTPEWLIVSISPV